MFPAAQGPHANKMKSGGVSHPSFFQRPPPCYQTCCSNTPNNTEVVYTHILPAPSSPPPLYSNAMFDSLVSNPHAVSTCGFNRRNPPYARPAQWSDNPSDGRATLYNWPSPRRSARVRSSIPVQAQEDNMINRRYSEITPNNDDHKLMYNGHSTSDMLVNRAIPSTSYRLALFHVSEPSSDNLSRISCDDDHLFRQINQNSQPPAYGWSNWFSSLPRRNVNLSHGSSSSEPENGAQTITVEVEQHSTGSKSNKKPVNSYANIRDKSPAPNFPDVEFASGRKNLFRNFENRSAHLDTIYPKVGNIYNARNLHGNRKSRTYLNKHFMGDFNQHKTRHELQQNIFADPSSPLQRYCTRGPVKLSNSMDESSLQFSSAESQEEARRNSLESSLSHGLMHRKSRSLSTENEFLDECSYISYAKTRGLSQQLSDQERMDDRAIDATLANPSTRLHSKEALHILKNDAKTIDNFISVLKSVKTTKVKSRHNSESSGFNDTDGNEKYDKIWQYSQDIRDVSNSKRDFSIPDTSSSNPSLDNIYNFTPSIAESENHLQNNGNVNYMNYSADYVGFSQKTDSVEQNVEQIKMLSFGEPVDKNKNATGSSGSSPSVGEITIINVEDNKPTNLVLESDESEQVVSTYDNDISDCRDLHQHDHRDWDADSIKLDDASQIPFDEPTVPQENSNVCEQIDTDQSSPGLPVTSDTNESKQEVTNRDDLSSLNGYENVGVVCSASDVACGIFAAPLTSSKLTPPVYSRPDVEANTSTEDKLET